MAHTIPNISSYHLFYCCYIPVKNQQLHIWVCQLINIITTSRTSQPSELSYSNLWFNEQVLPPAYIPAIHYLIANHTVSHTWHYSLHVYNLTEFGIRLYVIRVAIQPSHKDSSIYFNNSDRCPTPSLDEIFDFGCHHALVAAFEDIVSSTKMCTGPLPFPPSLHSLTAHHALQDLDNQIIHPEFPSL